MTDVEVQKVSTFDEVMKLEWEKRSDGYFYLKVEVGGCKAFFHMHGRPNYCDRGHWQVHCEHWIDEKGFNTLDHADFFPRLYMSFDSATDEIRRFIAWRALKQSDGLDELIKHNQRTAESLL